MEFSTVNRRRPSRKNVTQAGSEEEWLLSQAKESSKSNKIIQKPEEYSGIPIFQTSKGK